MSCLCSHGQLSDNMRVGAASAAWDNRGAGGNWDGKSFAKALHCPMSWDGLINEAVVDGDQLKNFPAGSNRRIALCQSENGFLLLLTTDLSETAYLVASNEVAQLLNSCLQAFAQK